MQGAGGVKASEGTKRASIFGVDAPRGKVHVAYIADRDFDAWRPRFERVARGVVLPR